MARLADPGQIAALRTGLSFAEVPERLRPSRWRDWLDELPQVPSLEEPDQLEAAYGVAELPLAQIRQRPPADPHWRARIAAQRQHDAYIEWLHQNGLTSGPSNSLGVALPGWHWSDLEQWEQTR